MSNSTMLPREIVRELNKHIIGQDRAKKLVSIALRNRMRRMKVPEPMRSEIVPKNILMIGPTGVGKTEIARRLAMLSNAPFVKVEATKFTEVGYVGMSVDSIIKDLCQIGMKNLKERTIANGREKARAQAEERILDILMDKEENSDGGAMFYEDADEAIAAHRRKSKSSRSDLREKLRKGELDDEVIDVPVQSRTFGRDFELDSDNLMDLGKFLSSIDKGRTVDKRMPIKDALDVFIQEEAENSVDMDSLVPQLVSEVENNGIVFIDEIDKIARANDRDHDVSGQGVQRDLLPLVEGTSIKTKYGMIKTNHILFIASGAFHTSKVSDLMPEFQGRFPIRVEMDSLSEEDFRRILVEPDSSLIKQYTALLDVENIDLKFTDDGIAKIAEFAFMVNDKTENIGARRLHTIMEKILEDVSFEIPQGEFVVDAAYVEKRLEDMVKEHDHSRYVL